jgi:hypothetical protein
MICSAKVQEQVDKKRNRRRLLVYLPTGEVKRLNIKKGNIINMELTNPEPERVLEPKDNFKREDRTYESSVNEKSF